MLLLLPGVAQAQLSYTDNGDGTATITGCDPNYNGALAIPDTTNGLTVTSIGDGAFFGCTKLANITIPSSITNIGIAAFNSCLTLTNVAIPASVISIGDYAFFYCTNLTAIAVDAANPSYSSADGVLFNKDRTILMQFPFGKTGSYLIPGSVTGIADEAFGMNDHGQYPFSYSACAGLTNLIVPGSITNIGDYAFSHCAGLTCVTISNGVASLGVEAFSWCSDLTSITIPDSVTSIGQEAFYYSGLTNVTIPDSVTNFGVGAFAVCSSLTSVTIRDGVTSIGEAGFNFCTNLTSITIPDSVTSIGERAFWFCTALTNVSISSNVTNVGPYAFSACSSLINITVNPDNESYSSVDGVLFNNDRTVLIQFPGGKGGGYMVPDGVIIIGGYAFGSYDPYGYSFFYLPSGMNLTSINFPGSVTTIGEEVFYSLTNLTGFYFEGNAPVDAGNMFYVFYDFDVTLYYLPGVTGWDTGFAGLSTKLWLPQMNRASFREPTNQFGFNINWARGETVVVEACTNLANPDWQPVQTNTLTTGSAYFGDPQWTNFPARFYRLRSP